MRTWKLSYQAFAIVLGITATFTATPPICRAGEPASKPIRVALYADKGATLKSLPEVENCLTKSAGFAVTKVLASEIRVGTLDHYEVLICPGGSGSGEGEALGDDGRNRVRDFVKHGGGYVGICAGAYLASIEYPWSLGLLNAHVLDRAHWDRGEGNVKLRISKAGEEALCSEEGACTIHYENGPLLGPGKKEGLAEYELLASYDTEMTQNSPAGTMKGTAAIARGKFVEGRVICFSPHPEKTPGKEGFLQSAVRWAAGLTALVGQDVVLRGRFDGPGKVADYIVTEGEEVYLMGDFQANANSVSYGTQVAVHGKLQRYRTPTSGSGTSDKSNDSRARIPEYYFIESPKIVRAAPQN